MTPAQARLIAEAHNIGDMDHEESLLLERHNPELLEAYDALLELANTVPPVLSGG